jgi:hypothetical protein
MPLHLLHHKSWHVYNSANVDRVNRDKESARRKQEDEEQRQNKADQQRRLAQLRGNAYDDEPAVPPPDPSVPVDRPRNTYPGGNKKAKHVNLFEEEEAGKTKPVERNPEREKELAIERKKWEDQITSRLINATNEHAPWYAQLDGIAGKEREKSEVERELRAKKQEKWKAEADPLKAMEGFLARKREVEDKEERTRRAMEKEFTERERRRRGRTPEMSERRRHPSKGTRDRETEKKRSRSRSPRSHRHRHKSSPLEKSSPSGPDLSALRAEKERRERAEREKIARLRGERDARQEDRYQPVGHAGYSAQFNPEAVRR